MSDQRSIVLYDGDCPICRREIEWLQRRNRQLRLTFEDIAAAGFDPTKYGLTTEEVQGQLHVVQPGGRVLRGVDAIEHIYKSVELGWMAAPLGVPGIRWLADKAYQLFARYRIPLGNLMGRRKCKDGACATGNGAAKTEAAASGQGP